jgi:exodeoxyribonuclease VII large subunit
VDALQVAGQGDLYEQFLRLKQQLQSEGLFEAGRKRELSLYPRRIGLVTSPDGAALHDVITTLKRHVPHVPVVFSPSLVQGPQAPGLLIQALNRLKAIPEVDVVLLVRGGGSLEDLWAFNDEGLVRHLAALPWPVITGVGHETDFTLVDFVSDCRAPTPTAAAEMCASPARACHDLLDQWEARMSTRMHLALNHSQQRLDQCAQALKQPRVRLHDWQRGLDRITWQLRQALTLSMQTHQSRLRDRAQQHTSAWDRALVLRRNQLSHWAVRLEALNPDQVLARGFVRLSDRFGSVVASVHQLEPGDAVLAHFHDGEAGMQVEAKRSV